MLVQEYLKFCSNILKLLGYRWDVNKLSCLQIAYCFLIIIPRNILSIYFLVQRALIHKNIERFVLQILQIIIVCIVSLSNCALLMIAIFYRRKLRRKLFHRIDCWTFSMRRFTSSVETNFNTSKKLSTIVISFGLTIIISSSLMSFLISPAKFSKVLIFLRISASLENMTNFLNPIIIIEIIRVIGRQFEITNNFVIAQTFHINDIKELHTNFSKNIQIFNKCFSLTIFIEVFKNFIFFVSNLYYFAQVFISVEARLTLPVMTGLSVILFAVTSAPFLMLFFAADQLQDEVKQKKYLYLTENCFPIDEYFYSDRSWSEA